MLLVLDSRVNTFYFLDPFSLSAYTRSRRRRRRRSREKKLEPVVAAPDPVMAQRRMPSAPAIGTRSERVFVDQTG